MRQTSPASTKSQVNWTCVAVHRPVGLEAELTLHRLVEQRERAPRSTSAGKDAGLAAPCSETCSDALSARRTRSVSGPSSSMRSTKTRQRSIAATASSEPVPTAGPSWFRSQQSAHSSARARSRPARARRTAYRPPASVSDSNLDRTRSRVTHLARDAGKPLVVWLGLPAGDGRTGGARSFDFTAPLVVD